MTIDEDVADELGRDVAASLGYNTTNIDATALILDFFDAHRREAE